MKFVYRTLLIWAMGLTSVLAHTPYEVSYFFKLDEKKLIVHLTPKSATDLLKGIRQDVKDASVIRLADYHETFEDYFNRHIHLVLGNDKKVKLFLESSDLAKHESSFQFSLRETTKKITSYHLRLTCFTDIYKKAKNHVTLSEAGKRHRYVLNRSNNEVHNTFENFDQVSSTARSTLFTISILIILAMLGWTVHRKQHYVFKPFSRNRVIAIVTQINQLL